MHRSARLHDVVDGSDEVAVVRWPEERDRAAELAGQSVPYLMLVAADAAPPSLWPELADWIRVPANEADLCFRLATLRRRAAWRSAPRVDEFDVLWRGAAWVGLSPTQARIMRCLIQRPETVVTRALLSAAGWPAHVPAERSIDVYVGRLRTRIRILGLDIATVRGRGYALQVGDALG